LLRGQGRTVGRRRRLKGAGAMLLRTMSLNDVVMEYQRLKAEGQIAA
jgi:hypothetical protein